MVHESIRLVEYFLLAVQNRPMTKSAITPFPLRLAPELREKLEAHAKQVGRSLQSEISARLELTFELDLDQIFSATNTRGISLNYDELAEALMRQARENDELVSIKVTKKPPSKPTRKPKA